MGRKSFMGEMLCSTGAFIGRVNDRDHRGFLRIADSLTADAFEFMMYESWYEKAGAVLSDFIAGGYRFPVFHVEKRIGEYIGLGGEENRKEAEKRFSLNCEYAARLGSEKLVLHLWNGIPSDRNFQRHMAAYPVFADIAGRFGLLLTVENVVCAVGSPIAHLLALHAAYPDAAFTYDTKMAAFHREETALFTTPGLSILRAGKVRHIHLNDYGGGYRDFEHLRVLHLGEGHVDIAGFTGALLRAGYRGTVTLECSCMRPDGTLTPEKMNASLAIARELMKGCDRYAE